MNVLIVGGAGFVGANLARFCLSQPETRRVTVIDSLEPELKSTTRHLLPVWDQIRFTRTSLLDTAALSEAVQGHDLIFNCAGQTSHPLSMQDPLLDARLNIFGNLNLLETVRHVNANAIVVFASTSTAIGKARATVINDDHIERPLEIYSANKGVAEKYYQIHHINHGLKTVALRFANLFGPFGKGFPEFGFMNYFIDLASNGDEIRIFGDGRQMRNVMYVEDACSAMWAAARTPSLFGQIRFAVHDEHLSVHDIANGIVETLGSGSVVFVPWPEERKRIEVDNVRIDGAPFREATGWRPKYTFVEGLRQLKRVSEGKTT